MRKITLLFTLLLFASILNAQALTGNYYIPKGTNQQGYNTLAEAFTAFNANGASGTVNFLIDGDLNETGANLIILRNDLTAVNNLVIKPNTGKTPVINITGASQSGNNIYSGLTIDNTSYVTLDGSNSAGGTTRDLTINMNDSTYGRIGITAFGNTDNLVMKNLKIKFTKVNVANISTRGIYLNGQSSGVADSLIIQNNQVGDDLCQPAYAISITGSSGQSYYCSKVYIKDNLCYATMRRIYFYFVGTAGSNCEISGNTIIGSLPPLTANVAWGILLNTYNGPINIYRNKLHVIRDTNAATQGIYGLGTLTSGPAGTLNIFNNFFGGDFTHTGTGTPASVDIVSFQDTCRNVKMYYNTIVLNNLSKTSARLCAVRMGLGTVEMKNNIFYTDKEDTNLCLIWFSGGTLVSNYNSFYTAGTSAFIGNNIGVKAKTLANWVTSTGQDSNSIFANPGLVSMTDFHLTSAQSPVVGKGTPISWITTDIDNDIRKAIPDIGGDEKPQPAASITLLTPAAGAQLTVGSTFNITWTSTNVSNIKIEYSTNNGTAWSTVAASVTASLGTYQWTVPNTVSAQCLVKLSDVASPTTLNISQMFSIIPNYCKDVVVNADWNIISVPAAASNMRASVLFPAANSPAYAYNGGYTIFDTLIIGRGFWLRFPAPATYSICGTQITATTVPVVNGWNLIGVYGQDVPVTGITSTPSGIVNSLYYGFGQQYQVANTLNVGKGYWVRTSQAGVLNLNTTAAKNNPAASAVTADNSWIRLTLTDRNGKLSTLYLSGSSANAELYSLPPLPPAGVFDLRFSSQRSVENVSNLPQISWQGAKFPVTVRVDNGTVELKDVVNGNIINTKLTSGQSFVIDNEAVQGLQVSGSFIPKVFALEQNYPNPFNPSTLIAFSIPNDGRVRMELFNILGQRVALLLDEVRTAGRYEVPFNASGYASGPYIYSISHDGKTISKKLTILK